MFYYAIILLVVVPLIMLLQQRAHAKRMQKHRLSLVRKRLAEKERDKS